MTLYSKMQRLLYTFCYYLALPVLLCRLLWRSRANPEYRQRWGERFAFVGGLKNAQPTIWLHAVSVGETIAAIPLISRLLASYPNDRLVVTSTTPTGSAMVKKHFANKVTNVYLPYDLPGVIRRFLKIIQPKIVIIMETELWPNLLHVCHRSNIPLMLANARLSPKSMGGYQKIASLTASMLQCFNVVAAQAEADGQRFVSLGLPKERLNVAGNIKFDVELPESLVQQGQQLRASWGGTQRSILIAASTHESEDEIVLDAFKTLHQALPELLLILVPRHPERFDKVAALCQDSGFSIARRSQKQPVTQETAILVGDTMGEMMLFYAAADVALVAGSFVPVGGHNLIEPAILGLPVLTGPHLHNFIDISQLLINANAAKVVTNAEQLAEQARLLLDNADARQQMGQRGRDTILTNRGALDKHMVCIDQCISSSQQSSSDAVGLT